MTIESRIAALKTALAEKHSEKYIAHGAAHDSFLSGASALAEVYRLEGALAAHKEIAEFNDASKETILRHLYLMHKAGEAQLEALLKRLEEKV